MADVYKYLSKYADIDSVASMGKEITLPVDKFMEAMKEIVLLAFVAGSQHSAYVNATEKGQSAMKHIIGEEVLSKEQFIAKLFGE